MKSITHTQQQILDYLRLSIRENGYPPTVREIQSEFHWASPNAAATHLQALKAKGFIEWRPGDARTIQILDQGRQE